MSKTINEQWISCGYWSLEGLWKGFLKNFPRDVQNSSWGEIILSFSLLLFSTTSSQSTLNSNDELTMNREKVGAVPGERMSWRTHAHAVKSVPWPRTRSRYPRHRLERLRPRSLDSEVKPRWWYHCLSPASSSTFLINSRNSTWTMD